MVDLFEKERRPILDFDKMNPIAKRFEREIGEVCTAKFRGGLAEATTVASVIFRRLVINAASKMFKPGSPEGLEFITKVYNGAKEDATLDWGG